MESFYVDSVDLFRVAGESYISGQAVRLLGLIILKEWKNPAADRTHKAGIIGARKRL